MGSYKTVFQQQQEQQTSLANFKKHQHFNASR